MFTLKFNKDVYALLVLEGNMGHSCKVDETPQHVALLFDRPPQRLELSKASHATLRYDSHWPPPLDASDVSPPAPITPQQARAQLNVLEQNTQLQHKLTDAQATITDLQTEAARLRQKLLDQDRRPIYAVTRLLVNSDEAASGELLGATHDLQQAAALAAWHRERCTEDYFIDIRVWVNGAKTDQRVEIMTTEIKITDDATATVTTTKRG